MELITIVVLLVIGWVAVKMVFDQARRKRLMAKYADARIVDMMMKRMMWQGMSAEQLIDSLGHPVAMDRKVYKTKISETYKYNQAGRNRFRSRVKLENGVVVGWDLK